MPQVLTPAVIPAITGSIQRKLFKKDDTKLIAVGIKFITFSNIFPSLSFKLSIVPSACQSANFCFTKSIKLPIYPKITFALATKLSNLADIFSIVPSCCQEVILLATFSITFLKLSSNEPVLTSPSSVTPTILAIEFLKTPVTVLHIPLVVFDRLSAPPLYLFSISVNKSSVRAN